MKALLAALVLAACTHGGDDSGADWADRCDDQLISLPTREPTWIEKNAAMLIGGNVYYAADCDEPELAIAVTLANEAAGFEETVTASSECVQIFPTTGATRRDYTYIERVPLSYGHNRIEVRAGSRCGALEVSCAPCMFPDASPPLPDAAPADAAALDGGI